MQSRCLKIVGFSAICATAVAYRSRSYVRGPQLSHAHCDETAKPLQETRHQNNKTTADCKNPVCQSTSDMFMAALKGQQSSTAIHKSEKAIRCPLDKDALGRSTWDLIHTLAAYYPETPSADEQRQATVFFSSLAALYPCHICAEDFQESVRNNPPR
jgi:FAD-linked sulfhydryl oxidase